MVLLTSGIVDEGPCRVVRDVSTAPVGVWNLVMDALVGSFDTLLGFEESHSSCLSPLCGG